MPRAYVAPLSSEDKRKSRLEYEARARQQTLEVLSLAYTKATPKQRALLKERDFSVPAQYRYMVLSNVLAKGGYITPALG